MSSTTNYGELTQGEILRFERQRKEALAAIPHPSYSREDVASDDLLRQSGGSSVPTADALREVFLRCLRTVGPIFASDALALALSGALVQPTLALLFPTAASSLGALALFALLPMLAAYWLSGLYSEIWIHPAVELRQLTRVTTLCLLAAALGGLLSQTFPLWAAAAWPWALLLVPLLRNVTRRFCASRAWWGFPTLVIGTGDGGDDVTRALLRNNDSGLRPVVLTDPKKQCRHSVIPVINCQATLQSIIGSRIIRHAVVSLPDYSAAELREAVDRFSDIIPHVLVLSDQSTLPALWSTSRSCGRLSGMEVRNGSMLVTLQAVKRVIDVTMALLALFFGAPLLLAVAIGVKFTSPGPAIFGHSRIGLHGRRFKAWKFRTMRQHSEEILREHLANNPAAREEWDRDHKLRDDPRVTKFGKFARKASLDELPQLWNVVVGDMSLVGPRPIVNKEVCRYGNLFPLYTTVKPGITGMWQVSGRNDIGYEERVLLDQFYVRHWSPWLDIYILAKTVVALTSRSGAY